MKQVNVQLPEFIQSPENTPENTNVPLTSGFQPKRCHEQKKNKVKEGTGGYEKILGGDDGVTCTQLYHHPCPLTTLQPKHPVTAETEQSRRSACCPSPGHCISKVSDVYQSYQVNEILLHEYLIFSLPNREAQGGLWNEIRESSVSLPEKAEGSEIQPSLADSI